MQWIQVQTVFRERLQKQATRMWRIAPQAAAEAYALPAYDGFTEAQRNALGFRRPARLPLREFRTGSDGAVTFEILIPWELFPPADRLSLERVRLAVNIYHVQLSGSAIRRRGPRQSAIAICFAADHDPHHYVRATAAWQEHEGRRRARTLLLEPIA